FARCGALRFLHSFPTRRSSDLVDAGKKAFIVNRIGDFGFILAIMLIYWTFERIDFAGVFARLTNPNDLVAEPLGGVGVLTTIGRSEEHTSELQSLAYLVCRLLL